jgi:hypothetical protein
MTSKTENSDAALFGLADQIEAGTTMAKWQVDARTPSLLARAWTPLPPARSGFALSLREIRLARSQRARLPGALVPLRPE